MPFNEMTCLRERQADNDGLDQGYWLNALNKGGQYWVVMMTLMVDRMVELTLYALNKYIHNTWNMSETIKRWKTCWFGLVFFGCSHTPGTWSHSRGHYPSTSSLDWVWIQSERAKLKAWLTAYCYITLAAVYRQVLASRFNPARIVQYSYDGIFSNLELVV